MPPPSRAGPRQSSGMRRLPRAPAGSGSLRRKRRRHRQQGPGREGSGQACARYITPDCRVQQSRQCTLSGGAGWSGTARTSIPSSLSSVTSFSRPCRESRVPALPCRKSCEPPRESACRHPRCSQHVLDEFLPQHLRRIGDRDGLRCVHALLFRRSRHDVRRRELLLDIDRSAHRASNVSRLRLRREVVGGTEPPFEPVGVVAGKVEHDHDVLSMRPLCSGTKFNIVHPVYG